MEKDNAHDSLHLYTEPATMTSAGRFRHLFDGLPRTIEDLAGIAQGLLVHEHIAPSYGITLSDERRATVHIRPVERLLERLMNDDDQRLTTPRPVTERLAGNCRHFTVLMVAMLRAQGIPARARCGFGGYFTTGWYEDHWVCEYWNRADGRWVLADAQIDELQRDLFRIDFDLMNVPRDSFVIAGDAWARCRAGQADQATFGLSIVKESGLWWIAGNLIRDVAALTNMEMLPWDVWGAMPGPDDHIGDADTDLFDRLAALTQNPEAGFDELRRLGLNDPRVNVPPTVYNAVRGRDEPVVG